MEDISVGTRGRAVADIQTRLAALGYSVGPSGADGVFAAATDQAVRAFQAARGVPATGTVDGLTWRALVDATLSLGDRVLYLRRPHLHGEDVRQLQQALATLGFRCGVDGVFGVNTERAVREFQTNVGLESDGIVGRATNAALANLAPALADRAPALGPRQREVVFGAGLAGQPIAVHVSEGAGEAAPAVRECAYRLASLLELAGARARLDFRGEGVAQSEGSADVFFFARGDALTITIAGELGSAALAELESTLARRLHGHPVYSDGSPADRSVGVRVDAEGPDDMEALCQRVAVAVFDALAAAVEPDDTDGSAGALA